MRLSVSESKTKSELLIRALFGSARYLGYFLIFQICFLVGLRGDEAFTVLRSFGVTSLGKTPKGPMVEGSDGRLYGVAYGGGGFGYGTIYALNKDGSGVVDVFNFPAAAGAYLLAGDDGRLYVSTSDDGTQGAGTIFRIRSDGTEFEVLHRFGETPGDGSKPGGALIQADGMLFGITMYGGRSDWGTVFRLNMDGTDYTILYDCGFDPNGPKDPRAALLDGLDDWVYGTSYGGGTNFGFGTVYRVRKDGSAMETLHSFSGAASLGGGRSPVCALVRDGDEYVMGTSYDYVFRVNKNTGAFQYSTVFGGAASAGAGASEPPVAASDGTFYGTTRSGGASRNGTLYQFTYSPRILKYVISFAAQDGYPEATLLAETDGYLYGATAASSTTGFTRVFRFDPSTGTKQALVEFGTVTAAEPCTPYGGLLEAPDGMLYGTTSAGGPAGGGNIYRLDPTTLEYQSLRAFQPAEGEPAAAYAPLTLGADGIIYGTSVYGGQRMCGNTFAFDPGAGSLQVLFNFLPLGREGCYAYGGLIEGPDDYLYGTANIGGLNKFGTIFKLSKWGGDPTVIHDFGTTADDGLRPRSGLLNGGDGWFYGTTEFGANSKTGSVYRISVDGSGYQVLHLFDGPPNDGARPLAGLMIAPNGLLYGTCRDGGKFAGGVVFRLANDGGGYRVMHHFDDSAKEGKQPTSRLVSAGTEGLYGVALSGGLGAGGTLFRMDLEGGRFRVLHAFGAEGGDGVGPNSLGMTTSGALVGTTYAGGVWNHGAAFRVLPQSVEPLNATITRSTIEGGRLRLQAFGRPETGYHLESTTSVASPQWRSVGAPAQASFFGDVSFEDAATTGQKFYRVVTP